MLTSTQLPAASLTALFVGALFAGGQPSTVRLDFDARPECTTREELTARVAARSARIRFADDAATTLRATVAPGPGRTIVGELTVLRAQTTSAVRRIVAPSCEQATDALALIIVLAVDPEALTRPPEARSVPPAPPPPAPPVTVAPRPAPPSPDPVRIGWEMEAGAVLITGPAPGAMPAVRLGARITRDRASPWSPALVLSLLHGWTGGLGEPGGTASFSLDAANLDACPIRLVWRLWDGRGCASVLVGRLEVAGSDTYAPASVQRPFAAGGASLLVNAGLTARLVLSARLEAAASWTRDAEAFSPTVFHRTAPVTLLAGLSLGLRFR